MKTYRFLAKKENEVNEFVYINAKDDADARRKFLFKNNKHIAGVFTNSKGRNELVENKHVTERYDIRNKAYDELGKSHDYASESNRLKKLSKDYSNKSIKAKMNHTYGIFVAQEMEKKGYYLSKSEKQSIWQKVKKMFSKGKY